MRGFDVASARFRPELSSVEATRDGVARAIARGDGIELDWITDQSNPRWQRYRKLADFALAALDDRIREQLGNISAELAWYGEQARLARLIHREGDAGRHALAADGGKRARQALENSPASLADAHSKSPSRPAMPKEEDSHG